MWVAVDVHYEGDEIAHAAALCFNDWRASQPAESHRIRVETVAPYVPGRFFERELPCLLAVLRPLPSPRVVVVDGYVDLGDEPGLGRHLHRALNEVPVVVGVAKNAFAGADATEVLRGDSSRPLYVTATDSVNEWAQRIREMHGSHRIPTLLAEVDQLARGV